MNSSLQISSVLFTMVHDNKGLRRHPYGRLMHQGDLLILNGIEKSSACPLQQLYPYPRSMWSISHAYLPPRMDDTDSLPVSQVNWVKIQALIQIVDSSSHCGRGQQKSRRNMKHHHSSEMAVRALMSSSMLHPQHKDMQSAKNLTSKMTTCSGKRVHGWASGRCSRLR